MSKLISIGELSKKLGLTKSNKNKSSNYILRYWEKEFKEIKPIFINKRRYYSPEQIRVVKFIKTLLRDNDVIYANSFTWNIDNSEYLLTGNVKLENNTIALSSNKAILNKGNDIIEFFNPVKYIIKSRANKNSYEINSENAYYDINTKSVSFRSIEKRVRSKIYF